MKTNWEMQQVGGRLEIQRVETPLALWLLDRWFRVPDAISDWIEWRIPATSAISKVPCLPYARWYPQLVMRQVWTAFEVAEGPDAADRAPVAIESVD